MAWWDEKSDTDAKYAKKQGAPTRAEAQTLASNASTWAGVGQMLAQQVYGNKRPAARPVATKPASTRPATRPVQGPPTRQQAAQQSEVTWQSVVNRLRPALGYDRQPAQTQRPQSQQLSELDASVAAFNQLNQSTGVQPTQLNKQAYRYQPGGGVDTSKFPTEGLYVKGPPAQPAYIPTQNTYDTQPDRFGWDDVLRDNLGALWDVAGSSIRQDWSDVHEAGKGNFFNPVADAVEQQKEIDAARQSNQAVIQRARELQDIYYRQTVAALQRTGQTKQDINLGQYGYLRPTQMYPGGPTIYPAQTLSIEPFLQAAEQEMQRPILNPAVNPLTQAASVASGVAQNVSQIPGPLSMPIPGQENTSDTGWGHYVSLGAAANVLGNTLGTVLTGFDTLARGAGALPATVPTDNYDQEGYVSAAEALGAVVDTVAGGVDWAQKWTWDENPYTLFQQAYADNIQNVIDTTYSIGPEIGQPITSADDQRRYERAVGMVLLGASNQASHAAYVDAVVNRDQHLADLIKQRKAASLAAQNMMLPEDVRGSNAALAAQLQGRITMLENADAIQLAQEHMNPIRDALIHAALDPTLWYELLSLAKFVPNMSPQARRLRATQDVLNRSKEEVAAAVEAVTSVPAKNNPLYSILWEGGLSQTSLEVADGKRLFANMFADVSDKADIPKILQYMVDNPEKFASQGLPANLVSSPTLKAAADTQGFIRLVRGQMQEGNFRQLYTSLQNVSGQFANLPSLSVATANMPEVIEDLLTVVEIQSAVRNKVSPFRRAVPIGTTEARVSTVTNQAGDLLYRTEYLSSDGRVIARYLAPSESVALMETKLATANIKAGKYVNKNFVDMATRFARNSFSMQVLVTVPGSWVTNWLGALTTGFAAGSNSLMPIDNIMGVVKNAFPNGVPYEYMVRSDTGEIITGPGVWGLIPKTKKVIGKMREIRGGQTEIRLPGGRSIKFGENAHKLGNWYRGFQKVLGEALDSNFRTVAEPALAAQQMEPSTLQVLRTMTQRLASDGDVQRFYDEVTQYAIGRKQTVNVAELGATYEKLISDRNLWTKVEQVVEASNGDPKTFTDLWTQMVDEEIAKAANTAGYDPTIVTVPHDTAGDIADMLKDTTVSIEAIARSGVTVGEDGLRINEAIAQVQDHIRRVWSLAVNARTTEAMEQFSRFYDGLMLRHRDIQQEVLALRNHARSLNTDEGWLAYHQARLTLYKQYGEDAIQVSEQALARVLGGEELAPPPVRSIPIEPAEAVVPAAPALEQSLAEMAQQRLDALMIQQEDAQRLLDQTMTTQVQPVLDQLRQMAQQLQQPAAPGLDTAALQEQAMQLMQQASDLQRQAEQTFAETLARINDELAQPLPEPPPAAVVQQVAPPVAAPTQAVAFADGDISAANVDNYGDGRWIYPNVHFEEANRFFQIAEEKYRSAFIRVAQQSGDVRAMDVYMQIQKDINRMRSEWVSQFKVAEQQFKRLQATNAPAVGPRVKDWRQTVDKFYAFKAGGWYDLGVAVDAKWKAGLAYLQSMPEPVTFRHSAYGNVTVVGYRSNGIAIRLPSGAVTVVAEDAIPLPTLELVRRRQSMLASAAKDPFKSAVVEGIPEKFAKAVDKAAKQFYDMVVTSRQNMYAASPTVSDAVGDWVLLLDDLRNQGSRLAKQLSDPPKPALKPKQSAAIVDYANQVRREWRPWVEAASDYGNKLASNVMIMHARSYRLDQLMSMAFPFHTWTTRTGKNLIERLSTQPLLRHAINTESALFEHLNDDSSKEYATFYVGGVPVRAYASLSKYLMSMADLTNDLSYYEKRAIGGPLGPVYAAESATGAGAYPWVDAIDNYLRKWQGMEDTNTSLQTSNPWMKLGWSAANAAFGSNVPRLAPWAFTDDDIHRTNDTLQAMTARGEVTKQQAYLAHAALENYLYGTPWDKNITKAQQEEANKLLDKAIRERGLYNTIASATQMTTGITFAPQSVGMDSLREAESQYFDAEYPGNLAGGTTAQSYIADQNPAIAVGWLRFSLEGDQRKKEPNEPIGTQAMRMELQEKKDAIYDEMNDAVTQYIIDKSGTVASYKAVADIKKPFYAQVDALEKQYNLPELDYGPRNVAKMNPYERAVYELEQVLRYDGEKPERPTDDMTPEQQVDAWAAITKWESARLDFIERTIEAVGVSYEGPGDPPADLWVKELERITSGEYASELVRKYEDLKHADRVERQWSPYGTFEKEMDTEVYAQQAENVRQRLGAEAVRVFQVYNRVKDENKEQYRLDHPAVTTAMTAAYNPESYDQLVQLFGDDAWKKYEGYRAATRDLTYPEGGTDEQVAAYYEKVSAIQDKYPGIQAIDFWVDGRHRWWYGTGEEQYRSTEPGPREGAMGYDYAIAQELFGADIFEVVAAFPSGGSKKEIAKFYDKYPQYAGYNAWRKQYNNLEEMTLADLPTLNMSQLPAEAPDVPASIPPWWTQFARPDENGAMPSRPLGSGRELINETPQQTKLRVAREAEFRAQQQAEAAKQKRLKEQGRAATVDSDSYQDGLEDTYNRRYGRSNRRSSRRYYGGNRGYGRRSYGGGGGGSGFIVPDTNPALWQQPKRNITPLNVGGDISPNLWASLLERLRRPGK